MSFAGRQLERKFENDPSYVATVQDISNLLNFVDGSDSDVVIKALESIDLTVEQFANDYADVAQNVKVGGVILNQADDYNKQEIAEIFSNPPQSWLGTDEGLASRNRLLLELAKEKTTGGGRTNKEVFRQNSSDTESVVVGSANQISFLEASLYVGLAGTAAIAGAAGVAAALFGVDNPFAGPTSADEVNARLSEALNDSSDVELTEQQALAAEDISDATAKQCVLLNLLRPLDEYYNNQLRYKPDLKQLPYGGKVIKFKCDPVSHFTNYLTAVPDINKYYTNREQSKYSYLMQPIVDARLSFIRTDSNGSLVELPIINSSNKVTTGEAQLQTTENINPMIGNGSSYSTSKKPPSSTTETILSDIQNGGATHLTPASKAMQNINFGVEISYEGTNPSTARNDVDVVITFKASTIDEFNKTWSYEYDPDVNYSLFDLVLFPFYDKDADGYGKMFKSQFSPNYNRLRLYYRARANKTPQSNDPPSAKESSEIYDWYLKNSNVLDLTVIDHDFSRNGESDQYELKITYKGYVQSLLTRPETDALSDEGIKETRKARESLLEAAAETGCSQVQINRIITSLNTAAQADIKDITAGILKDLYLRKQRNTGKGIFLLDNTQLREAIRNDSDGVNVDTLRNYIAGGNPIINEGGSNNLATQASLPAEGVQDSLVSGESIYFFYIADLLDVILEHSGLFKGGGVSTSMGSIKQELKFILGSFNYIDTSGNTYNINIGHVPISVDFFKEWYKETIVDKDLYIYPCLSFIRDLFERVLTNLLSEVCYKTEETQRFLVRTSFFAGSKIDGAYSNDSVLDYYYDTIKNQIRNDGSFVDTVAKMSQIDNKFYPLITNDYDKDVTDYNNYCIIYVQGPAVVTDPADSRFVPEFHINNGNVLGERDFTFSKTDQTGLREARYFRNSSSGITMLASVYNTTVTLEVPLCFLYPGQFYKITMESGKGNRPTFQPGKNSKTYHIFEELGLDGYYAITKSTYKLFGAINNLQAECQISGIWVSSTSPYHGLRNSRPDEDRLITDPTELIQLESCDLFTNRGEEISAAAAAGNIRGTLVLDGDIANLLSSDSRTSAEDELIGQGNLAGISGAGSQNEREALLEAARSGEGDGFLTDGDNVVEYQIFTDDDGNINAFDQSTGAIIGTFRKDDENKMTFTENPAYFGGGQ